jgi:hypothetical protein
MDNTQEMFAIYERFQNDFGQKYCIIYFEKNSSMKLEEWALLQISMK